MKNIFKIIAGLTTLSLLTVLIIRSDFSLLPQTAQAVGDLTINWGVPEGDPIFTVTAAAPGQVESRSVLVTNNASSSRPLGVRGVPTSVDSALGDALSMTIKSGATTLYGPTSLNQFFTNSTGPDGISLIALNPGQSVTLEFIVTFEPTAGNNVQNTQAVFDIELGLSISVPTECVNITFSGNPIFGTERGDSIQGTAGNDLIFGLEGGDSIKGLGGSDCIVGGSGGDSLYGGSANDVIYGNEGGDSLKGEAGNDQLFGGEDSDSLDGADGQDQLLGDSGSDSLRGGNNNDLLTGGSGEDSARGEGGTDTCDAEAERTCEL